MIDMDAETWQMNVEELLALQSILQSSLLCFVDGIQRVIDDATAEELMQEGCRGRQLSCTANVHPCMPDGGLTIQVKASTGSNDSKPSAQEGQAAGTAHLRHLPPISLAMTFHDNYPQQDPPGMQLTAEWLSSEQADSLAQQLLGLWKEQGPGGPICFTWTDWLQNNALPFLGVTETLLLTFDPHAVPAAESGEDSLAATDPSQSRQQASEPAAGSKPSADSLFSSSSASQQPPDSNACREASGSALIPRPRHVSSRQHADTLGAGSASTATSMQTGSAEELGSQSGVNNLDTRRVGRRKHRGSPQRSPAQALDPCAVAWQPQAGLPLPQLAPDQQRRPDSQKQGLGPSQQTEQAAAAVSPATLLLNSKAKPAENSSNAHMAADRENGCHETESADSQAAGSSTAGASQPMTSRSDMGRVVQLYMHLTAYSKGRERELFQEGQHTCSICLEELPGASFVWPGGCDHASCKECVRQLCNLHVAEGGLENLRCPDPKCKEPFNRQCLGGLLDEEQLQRWEDLELALSLQKMPDCVYCPRCSSACLEDAENCAQCPKCFFAFCSLCNESWHPGIECMSAETKLELLRQRMAGMSVSVAELRRKELEYMSLVRIQETSKRCPACGMAIQKSAGCNKMTCGNCGAFFCWRCNKEVDGYDHFRSGKCILFDHAEIQRWEVEFQVQIERAQAQARNAFWGDVGGRRRSRACPSCGQANHKMNDNNHMRCWACTAHFCYLCRQTLRGTKGTSGAHFGKAGSGKCRQHSAD